MQPPSGLNLALSSLLEDASPTSILMAAASSILPIGVDMPFPTVASIVEISADIITSSPHAQVPNPENGECRLLGPFAIFVQGALGLLALLALVYKRWRERPQRPMKIWFFDASKQVVGSVLVHIANLLMSMLSSGQLSIKLDANSIVARGLVLGSGLHLRDVDANGKYRPNPCSFYLLNLGIDTTLGIPILIFLLRILTALFSLTPVGSPPESIQSGNYGSPPRTWWWFKQSLIYFIGLMGMKICVLIIFLVVPWISRVGDWALKWTEGDEVLQVVFVMLVFPLIMNATQYYIIDTFIKNQKPLEHERMDDDDDNDSTGEGAYEDPCSGSSDEINSGDEDDEILVKADDKGNAELLRSEVENGRGGGVRRSPKKPGLQMGNKDYDPLFDGESSPTVVGSASTSERAHLVSTEDSEDEGQRKAFGA